MTSEVEEMQQEHPAADRVRHILKAMERSIEQARSSRTHVMRPAPVPVAATPPSRPVAPMAPQPVPVTEPTPSAPPHPSMLKARPKRSFTNGN
jgi:hypothetical protein